MQNGLTFDRFGQYLIARDITQTIALIDLECPNTATSGSVGTMVRAVLRNPPGTTPLPDLYFHGKEAQETRTWADHGCEAGSIPVIFQGNTKVATAGAAARGR